MGRSAVATGAARTRVTGIDPAQIAALTSKFSDWYENDRDRTRLPPEERDRLHALWREQGRLWPAYLQAMFLYTGQAQAALGGDYCARHIHKLQAEEKKRAMTAPSHAWVDAWGYGGEELPRHPLGRRYAVRLRRRREIRDRGILIRPAGRWTPPQCFTTELECDNRDPDPRKPAKFNEEVRSPSAVAIGQIGMRRAVEQKQKGREKDFGLSTVGGNAEPPKLPQRKGGICNEK